MHKKIIAIFLFLFLIMPARTSALDITASTATQIINWNQMPVSSQTCFAGLASPIGVGNLTPGTNGQVLTTTLGVPTWGSAGAGSVTSISQGTGITATPNPITSTGSIALNTTYTDGRYIQTETDPNWQANTSTVARTGTCSSNQWATATTTSGVTCVQPSTTNVTEGNNLYWTQSRFNSAFGIKTTADLGELTNLYFTNARAIAAVNNSGTYNISINASNVLNPNWITQGTKLGNTTSEIQSAINNSGYYNISINSSNILNVPESWTSTFNATYDAKPSSTFNQSYHDAWQSNYSAKTDYVNNATERTLFLSTYNASYIQLGGDLSGTVTAPTVRNTQGLTWGNITSGWDLNKAWGNSLGWGNISARSLNIAWTDTLGGSNISDATLSGTKIIDGSITTAELTAGTLNQANITNTVAACSNQFSRGMGATTQNCATVGNGDMTSGAYAAITGIGTQAQNLNMGNKNITNTTMVNASQIIYIGNNIFINGTGIGKISGGFIELA